MLTFRCSRHAGDGTPIIRDMQIADYAEELIGDYNPRYLYEPWELDPLKFAEYYLGANIAFVDIYCEEGEQIAGAAVFNREKIRLFDRDNMCTRCDTFDANTILIDNATMEEGKENFARFTILHEAGHIWMHPSVFRNTSGQMSIFDLMKTETEAKNVICCRKSNIEGSRRTRLETQEDFREHQANTFAAAVAMPKRIFTEIAREALAHMGCTEGYYLLPTIREDDYDPCADSLASYMGKRFNVSKSAARVQLRKYRLIKTSWEEFEDRQQMKLPLRKVVGMPVTIEDELPFA